MIKFNIKNKITTTIIFMLFSINIFSQKTIIKGKVHNWPTDTVYIKTMPFYSPYSSKLKYVLLKEDNSFSIELPKSNKPIVFQLSDEKNRLKHNARSLLFDNLTKRYYYGHCSKFYTHGETTHLIQQGKTLTVDITYNTEDKKVSEEKANSFRKLGIKIPENNVVRYTIKSLVKHNTSNNFENDLYQNSFAFDNILDERLEIYESKSILEATKSLNKLTQKMLKNLEKQKSKISPLFYDYIKAEIVYGAKKEFIKYLWFAKEREMDTFFSKPIPKEVLEIVNFDKKNINNATLINEEFNEYVGLYINFKLNMKNKKFVLYNPFNIQKFRAVMNEFYPNEISYYYIANHFLHKPKNELLKSFKSDNKIYESEILDGIVQATIKYFPKGELNDALIKKFDL